jgi:hypothetical protein
VRAGGGDDFDYGESQHEGRGFVGAGDAGGEYGEVAACGDDREYRSVIGGTQLSRSLCESVGGYHRRY